MYVARRGQEMKTEACGVTKMQRWIVRVVTHVAVGLAFSGIAWYHGYWIGREVQHSRNMAFRLNQSVAVASSLAQGNSELARFLLETDMDGAIISLSQERVHGGLDNVSEEALARGVAYHKAYGFLTHVGTTVRSNVVVALVRQIVETYPGNVVPVFPPRNK